MYERSLKILFVEDNVASAMVLANLLRGMSHCIEHVQTGKEAILSATNNDYDLILMDIGLPDISGLEAAKAIRCLSHSQRSQVPIVALTCHVDLHAICLGVGMQGLIRKPATVARIQQAFKRYVKLPHHSVDDSIAIDASSSADLSNDEVSTYQLKQAVFLDLKSNRYELVSSYKSYDIRILRRVLHHIKGGVCYIEAPALMSALEQFHVAVKDSFQDKEYLELSYHKAIKAIDAFCHEFEGSDE